MGLQNLVASVRAGYLPLSPYGPRGYPHPCAFRHQPLCRFKGRWLVGWMVDGSIIDCIDLTAATRQRAGGNSGGNHARWKYKAL